MTAPTPIPEEFAKRVFPTKIRVGQCAIDCASVEDTDEMQSRLNAAAASLTAPLREEVERLTREVAQSQLDWSRLCLEIAHRFDPECRDAAWSDIWEGFDPWDCIKRAEAENARLRAALDEAKNWLMSIAIVDQDDRPLNERLAREFDWRRRSTTQESMARRGHEAAAKALAPEGGPGKEATSGNR